MVWYEHANPNQATTLAMEQRERQVPQKGSTIEALTHRMWTNKSTGLKYCPKQPSIELFKDSS